MERGTAAEVASTLGQAVEGSEAPAFRKAGEALLARYDWKADAFGGPPFVPQPAVAEFLLALGLRTGHPLALKAALRSLSVLPKSELADAVDGGFFDRCDGPRWKRPHTRKSLATNAAMLQALSTAAAWTGEAALKAAAADTAAFVDLYLKAEEGDLWVAAIGPDEAYFESMAHARGRRDPPDAEGPASLAHTGQAISAFVRAGVCLEQPRLLARARLAMREVWAQPDETPPEEEAFLSAAAFDLAIATGERAWIKGAFKRIIAINKQGGPHEWQGSASALAGVFAMFTRVAGMAGEQVDDVYAFVREIAPPQGDPSMEAAFGLGHLVALTLPVRIEWRGPAPTDPSATAARAALAAAWALGPPGSRFEPQGVLSRGPPSLTIKCGERVSDDCVDPAQAKRMLRAVVDLKESI